MDEGHGLPDVVLRDDSPSPAVQELFPHYRHGMAELARDGRRHCIPFSCAGGGPALLLLHGHPQSRIIWSQIAGRLAQRFTVVVSDLRGYGDASVPPAPMHGAAHDGMSKRAMAIDQVALMQALGHERFALIGHDRGARVAHRLALDHGARVDRLMLLDIAPTLAMLEGTTQAFATAYWHWFFLVQPAPLPERLIGSDPKFWLEQLMGNRSAGLAPFLAPAWSEYLRFASDPATVHAMCEDYRAAASIDLERDRADRAAGRRLACPVRVLWAQDGVIGHLFDPLALWREATEADFPVTGQAIACGHYMPEQAPDELLAQINDFV